MKRGSARFERSADGVRETRLRSFGRVQRNTRQRMLNVELPARRTIGIPQRRHMDVVKENILVLYFSS